MFGKGVNYQFCITDLLNSTWRISGPWKGFWRRPFMELIILSIERNALIRQWNVINCFRPLKPYVFWRLKVIHIVTLLLPNSCLVYGKLATDEFVDVAEAC